MSRSHNLGAYVKSIHPNTINDKSRASLASMDVKMQTAIAGAANPTQSQIVLAHGDTGSAIVPLAVDGSGAISANITSPALGQALMAASLPVVIASDQTPIAVLSTPTLPSASELLWSAATPGAGGKSVSLEMKDVKVLDIFGDVDGACTLTLEVSDDDVTYYTSQWSYTAAGAEDFHLSFTTGAAFVRLDMDSAGVKVTAIANAKA